MPIPKALQEQLDDLALFPDRSDRIQALIALGEEYQHPSAEEVPRAAECKVPGCESEVFLLARPGETGVTLKFAVDNPQGISAMALAVILERGLSGQPLDAIQAVPEDLVFTIFGRELSMGKNLGLTNMIRMVKDQAVRISAAGLAHE